MCKYDANIRIVLQHLFTSMCKNGRRSVHPEKSLLTDWQLPSTASCWNFARTLRRIHARAICIYGCLQANATVRVNMHIQPFANLQLETEI